MNIERTEVVGVISWRLALITCLALALSACKSEGMGETCTEGSCELSCADGETNCNNSCIDPNTDQASLLSEEASHSQYTSITLCNFD